MKNQFLATLTGKVSLVSHIDKFLVIYMDTDRTRNQKIAITCRNGIKQSALRQDIKVGDVITAVCQMKRSPEDPEWTFSAISVTWHLTHDEELPF